MATPAIRCVGISKRYQLGTHSGPGRLTEAVSGSLRRAFRRRESGEPADRTLWALDDISFDLEPGVVLGLIGRNGAGKSTLLKILSRITRPTRGEAFIVGRLSSLLEVGTGFHPELTGRENIYLNGTILGMKHKQITERFDDIVDFSGIESFLDTPVKRYSSGMYARLAFSVSAHLASDVLLVDEVLAVGDQAFQQKCIGKMADVASAGRTVIFVSHNLGSITRLCDRAMWLENGRLKRIGASTAVIEHYLGGAQVERPVATFPQRSNLSAQLLGAAIRNERDHPSAEVSADESFTVDLDVLIRQQHSGVTAAIWMRDQHGLTILSSDISHADPNASASLVPGRHLLRVRIPKRLLAPGRYSLTAAVLSAYEGRIDSQDDFCSVTVVDHSTATGGTRAGVIGLNLPWEHRRAPLQAADDAS